MSMSQGQMEGQSAPSWRAILCSQDRPDDPNPQCATCGTKENLTICECSCAYHCCLAHRVQHRRKGHSVFCGEVAAMEQTRIRAEQEYQDFLREQEEQQNVVQNSQQVLREFNVRQSYVTAACNVATLALKMDTGASVAKANRIYRQMREIDPHDLIAWDRIWILEARMGNDTKAWEFTAMGAAADQPLTGVTNSRVRKFLSGPVEEQFLCSLFQPPTEILRYTQQTTFLLDLRWLVNLLVLKLKALLDLEDACNSEALRATQVNTPSGQYGLPKEIITMIRQKTAGELLKSSDNVVLAIRDANWPELRRSINVLRDHVLELAIAVDAKNPCFWPLFSSSKLYFSSEARPNGLQGVPVVVQEASMTLQQTFHAFVEGNMLEWLRTNFLTERIAVQVCQERWADYYPSAKFRY